MRARHGEDERFAVFGGLRRPWWTPLLPSPEGLVEAAMATIEQRAAYARLGL
ncbi:MAG: hypothetical protein NZ523_03400 [Elioraea sp.]|nr:hypothetical protein [Elioraea sp.]